MKSAHGATGHICRVRDMVRVAAVFQVVQRRVVVRGGAVDVGGVVAAVRGKFDSSSAGISPRISSIVGGSASPSSS